MHDLPYTAQESFCTIRAFSRRRTGFTYMCTFVSVETNIRSPRPFAQAQMMIIDAVLPCHQGE